MKIKNYWFKYNELNYIINYNGIGSVIVSFIFDDKEIHINSLDYDFYITAYIENEIYNFITNNIKSFTLNIIIYKYFRI